jgi:hypothetical protein
LAALPTLYSIILIACFDVTLRLIIHSKIRLELARTKDCLEGSRDIGYEFTAPLKADVRIDVDAFHKLKTKCRVRGFKKVEDEDDIGHLIRKPGGFWAFHYGIHSDAEDDESGYRFGEHIFKVGEYVSVQEEDELISYQVKHVEELK